MRSTPPAIATPPVAVPKVNGTGISSAPSAEFAGTASTSSLAVPAAVLQPVGAGGDHIATPQESTVSSSPRPPALTLVTAGNPAEVKVCDTESPQQNMLINLQDGQLGTVVDQFRQFVGTEREKVEAKKQSMARTERDKQLAELKKFHTNFKVSQIFVKDQALRTNLPGAHAYAKRHSAHSGER